MKIGIDASRAFLKQRTGIEEYSYQVIKNLRKNLSDNEVILYIRKNQIIDFEIPQNWKIKKINLSRFWTQIGLSLEMFLHPVDVLFVPAHTAPLIHPEKTIVTIHGLEYEIVPQSCSIWEKLYMRWSIKGSCCWVKNIISVSKSTKQDLIQLYEIPGNKIQIVYEGYDPDGRLKVKNLESQQSPCLPADRNLKMQDYKPFLLFMGRLEERKNIVGIIEAFEILKEKHDLSHKLVLAGRGGHGFSIIEAVIKNSKYKKDIIQLGFVDDEDKFKLISEADVFIFATFYEGFGIPILEAQSMGVPVVTSNISSMPEVAGDSALLVNPKEPWQIAEKTYELISNKKQRKIMIEKGYENIKRFSWEKCTKEIAKIMLEK